mmetsp:Transcript_4505/g.8366  ORF Transcript_4505/g.8366 Transcript_4505/m.8366 type:complete len:312 (+) Transcript_4505:140-1075(+)
MLRKSARTEAKVRIVSANHANHANHTTVDCHESKTPMGENGMGCKDECPNKSHKRPRKTIGNTAIVAITFLSACVFTLGYLLGESNLRHIDAEGRLSSDSEKEKFVRHLPDEWEKFSYKDMRRYFACRAHAKDQTKPLHSLEDWQFMRGKYIECVNSSFEFDNSVPPTLGYALVNNVSPPFYAKMSPGKGRGVFASRDINEGEIVHDGKRSAVMFPTAVAWRRFVFSLPRDMACDIMEWTWTQSISQGDKQRLLVDLNIAAFFNNGGKANSNVKARTPTSSKFIATRHIKKDTELLYDYGSYETSWAKVGL